MRAALFFVSVFGIGRLAVFRKCPVFRRSLVLVDVRERFHWSLKNQLLLMEESCTFAMLVHPGLEIFVVQLDGANVVIEVLFPRDSGNEGVVAHKLNVHEPPGRQVKHGPPHHAPALSLGTV